MESKQRILKKKIFDKKILSIIRDPIIDYKKINFLKRKKIENKFLQKKYFVSIGRLTYQKNFDNLIMADDKSLQTLLRNVDNEMLILSLKGADEQLREKIFSCMSTRAAANIQDEMGAMGPVRLTEVQEAQKQIISVARRLSDEGTIVLAGRGGDDFV